MLKKRLIFTLLYHDGAFMLSRNFRLQRVGDLEWLRKNYNFSRISYSIDELVILDVTRENRNLEEFCETLKALTDQCFVPIAAGGGVESVAAARQLLRSGADKIIINSSLFDDSNLSSQLSREFGQQCVIASIDLKKESSDGYSVWIKNGSKGKENSAKILLNQVLEQEVGEIYLNSIDRDGTGQGFDQEILDHLPSKVSKPIILAGGAGNAGHLLSGLKDSRVDAVATANLFNFIGDGLKKARESLVNSGIVLPIWNTEMLSSISALDSAKAD
jgi:cyclase